DVCKRQTIDSRGIVGGGVVRAAPQASADEENVPIAERAFGHAGFSARSTRAGAGAQSADNFTHHTDIGTLNSAFPKGRRLLLVGTAVATAPFEQHDRTGTNGQLLPIMASDIAVVGEATSL
ncbi:hypothetical protein, partial [Aromatoleum evansii]|uniref:hypothetical protein n=1 Tax=Aromatoleum evansii TaxID=59406 RepID=UPI001B7D1156